MITIFNRRELTVTWDPTRMAEIRNILSDHGIESMVKAVDFRGTSHNVSTFTGTFGLNRDYLYTYRIYVRSRDFEEAEYLMRDLP